MPMRNISPRCGAEPGFGPWSHLVFLVAGARPFANVGGLNDVSFEDVVRSVADERGRTRSGADVWNASAGQGVADGRRSLCLARGDRGRAGPRLGAKRESAHVGRASGRPSLSAIP